MDGGERASEVQVASNSGQTRFSEIMIHRSCQILLGAAVAGWTGAAFAVCLNGHPSLEQEYQSSKTIFVGRVASEELTPESKNYLDGTTYSVHVEEVLRGSPAKIVKLFSENSSGRFP